MVPRLVRSLVLFFFALSLLACIREPSPQLIQVLEVTPHDLELGDRVQILGAGFPQGRAAHLAFRGTLRRPAQRPIEGVEFDIDAPVTSSQQIELSFDERVLSLFCGVGNDAEHTTFDGEIEVAFAAAAPGAAPVVATLYKVTLDFRPPLGRAQRLDKRIKEGERALRYVGIQTAADPAPNGGLIVEKVAGGSRAEEAGIAAGDVLVAFDGVRVASPSDAIPHPGAQAVTLGVRRGTDPREQYREISFDGFRRAPPEELLGAAIILALAAAIVATLFAPFGVRFAWLERRIAARFRAAATTNGGGPRGIFAALSRAIREALGGGALTHNAANGGARVAPYFVCFALSAALLAFPFAQFRLAAGADVGILFLVATLSIVLLMLVAGLRASARVLSYEVAAAIAVACVIVMTGSLRLYDIVRAQGGWAWQWHAFRSPVAFALFALFYASLLPSYDAARPMLAEADGPVPATKRSSLIACVGWAHVFVMSSLGAALFLGGWQLPGVDVAQTAAHPAMQLVAGLVLVGKTWALVLSVALARWAVPRLSGDALATVAWKYLVPTALVAFALTVGWVFLAPGRAAQSIVSGATFAFVLLLVVGAARAIRHAYADSGAQARLNPFL
jgi:NADH-quinone oxidoreductase subunit H